MDVGVVGVALVLYLAISYNWQARSDKTQDFLTSLEAAVKSIAASASSNYDNTCGLQETCRSENCSKRECYPMDGRELQCVYVHDFAKCNASPGSQCNRVAVDFHRSMVRLPSNASMSFPDSKTLEAAVGPTVCTQRALDASFKSLTGTFSYSNASFFYNLYFAAADGVFRFYPARELLSFRCNALEPRVRMWYINSISVKKHLIVVLDTGATMTKEHIISGSSSLNTAKHLSRILAQSLSSGDTLTMFSVNSSGSFPVSAIPILDSSTSDEIADSLTRLLGAPALNGAQALNENPSQFKAAFEMANLTSGDALKVIVFFTDSSGGNVPPSDLLSATLVPIKAAGVGVFVYDLSAGNASSLWESNTVCGRSNDSAESDNLAQQNPFLFLHSYYSFLARARIAANNGSLVSWAKPYTSASDLGQVMTVSLPAMSSDNSVLIGVAGIDVQTTGLTAQLKGDLQNLLDSEPYQQRTTIPTIPTFADTVTTCSTRYLKSCNGSQTETLQPFCNSSTEPATDPELQKLMCCPGEGCSTAPGSTGHVGSLLRIVWIVVAFVFFWGLLCLVHRSIRKINNLAPKFSPLAIPWEELNLATNKFADDNIIGRGAFGVVYRGIFQAQKVTVKRLLRTPDKSDDFQAELRVNMEITKHPHLVELKATCFRGVETYLVYELVEGGDLYQWLWPEPEVGHVRGETGTVYFLTWNRRRQIAEGIAKGMNYLHRGLPDVKIFHLDLKPRNILLDKNFTPKIAEVGISQLYEPGMTFSIATVKAGTIGYMAPEILQGCLLPNTKMDVYSFGVVLMQLISGRKIDDSDLQPSFIEWARNLVEEDDVDKVIDKHLFESVLPGCKKNLMWNLEKMIDIAMDCTEPSPDNRPEMTEILWVLADLQDV